MNSTIGCSAAFSLGPCQYHYKHSNFSSFEGLTHLVLCIITAIPVIGQFVSLLEFGITKIIDLTKSSAPKQDDGQAYLDSKKLKEAIDKKAEAAAKKGVSETVSSPKTMGRELTDKEVHGLITATPLHISYRSTLIVPAVLDLIPKVYKGRHPKLNWENLKKYYLSAEFLKDAATAKAYCHAGQIPNAQVAATIVRMREPVNIAMQTTVDTKAFSEFLKLLELPEAATSFYNHSAVKALGEGQPPRSVCVYSETRLWQPPGGSNAIRIACLSVPAPALDTEDQPNYSYYIGADGKLNQERYDQEMEFLAKTVTRAACEHQKSAFDNSGLKRLVLSFYGLGCFLERVQDEEKTLAYASYIHHLTTELALNLPLDFPIAISIYEDHPINSPLAEMLVYLMQNTWGFTNVTIIKGDILQTAREGDLIVNAWDPHSAPGNGNDTDRSFDGAMGKGTAILFTQTSWLNTHLRLAANYIPV